MGWNKSDDKFINPYNFIELSNRCLKSNDAKDSRKRIRDEKNKKLMTGVINCRLVTKTPVFIPNTTNDNVIKSTVADHKSYDFFSYEDLSKENTRTINPVIPGSSIRGVIRSVYEALTDSCFGVVDEDKILYKRMPDAGQAAIIKWVNKEAYLYNSEKLMIKFKDCTNDKNKKFYKELKNVKDGTLIWVKKDVMYHKEIKGNAIKMPYVVSDVSLTEKKGYIKVYLIKGGMINNKHHYSAICADTMDNKFVAKLDKRDIQRLVDIVKLYGDEKINQNIKAKTHDGFKNYKKALEEFIKNNKDGKSLPVYYKEDKKGTAYYLSPSCITKEVYNNNISRILNEMGGFNSCTNSEKLCEACDLFGIVGERNNAVNSKIRFTDAKPKEISKDMLGKFITLKELSSPKISATEFYLQKNGDEIWTYDYSGNWRGQKLNLSKGYKAKLRGRKFYWNHKDGTVITEEPSNRNITIRPVNSNNEFNFKVFFERITEKELMKILWTLSLGENDLNSNKQHKIGMGKPIGLGSIKILIDSIDERIIDIEDEKLYKVINRKELIEQINDNIFDYNTNSLKQVKIAFDVTTPNEKIQYPDALTKVGKELQITNYGWFLANKVIPRNSEHRPTGTKPAINQTLPKITDKNIILFKYEEDLNNNSYRGNSRNYNKNNRNNNRNNRNNIEYSYIDKDENFNSLFDLLKDKVKNI